MKFKVEPEELIHQRLFRQDKASIAYQLKKLLYRAAVEVVGKRRVKLGEIGLEHPLRQAQGKLDHGDYATNMAMQIKHRDYLTSWDLANAIVNAIRSKGIPEFIAKIEVAKPGFINLWLHQDWLISQLEGVLREKGSYGRSAILKNKKILLEHTSPNPQTTIMLGHLRNNFLGMTTANLLEFLGVKVTKDCVVNDRGVHLCRAIWGYLVFGRKRGALRKDELLNFRKVTEARLKAVLKALRRVARQSAGLSRSGGKEKEAWQELLEAWVKKKSGWWQPKELGLKPDHANLIWYVLGSRAYKISEKVKKQVDEILLAWEAEDKLVRKIWRQILDWSAKGYQETYQRIGSVHDWVWHESNHYQNGKEIVEQGLKKGIFRKSEGAIVTDLVQYGLSDTVVVKTDGTAVYLTQDLALTKLKIKKFPSDLYIWDIGAEQILYFKQLFTLCEQLGIVKREKLFHLNYALINFKGGKKMATRRGDVVMADEVLDELRERAGEIIKESNQELRGKLSKKQLGELVEAVALGAIKYSLLKFGRETTIQFDIDESLALDGNSGPYLQYTYARCQSVLGKASQGSTSDGDPEGLLRGGGVGEPLNEEELAFLRTFYRFPEIIQESAEKFAPNLLCNFLYDLAQKYNLFYNKHRILPSIKNTSDGGPPIRGDPSEVENFRLALTTATAQILKNGLGLLGIPALERM